MELGGERGSADSSVTAGAGACNSEGAAPNFTFVGRSGGTCEPFAGCCCCEICDCAAELDGGGGSAAVPVDDFGFFRRGERFPGLSTGLGRFLRTITGLLRVNSIPVEEGVVCGPVDAAFVVVLVGSDEGRGRGVIVLNVFR